MPKLNRNSLKNVFKRGSTPSEVNFSDLIDSTINVVDDGFAKTPKQGLMLSPKGSSKRLISFYDNIRDQQAAWAIAVNKDKKNKGLSFQQHASDNTLFLKDGGQVGIRTNAPQYPLEVNGMLGMQGRIGTFKQGEVPGDGKWHTILEGLDDVQAFEVVANIRGEKGRGKYAFTHAIAISTFGRSSSRIKQTRAYFRWFWNRISLRWKSTDTHNFALQMRTLSHYGLNGEDRPRQIKYHITRLWHEQEQAPMLLPAGGRASGGRRIEVDFSPRAGGSLREDEIDL